MNELILLRGGEVFAPHPVGRVDVLVAGGRIAAAGAIPAFHHLPVEVVELDGEYVIPGLIDAHTHITGGGGEGGPETKVPPVPVGRFIAAGVTTVVGLLGTDNRTRSIAELLAAARGLERQGLSAFAYTGGYEVPPVTLTGSVRSDLVHVDRLIAIGETAISDHRSSQPTFEELVRLAADAHVAGLLTGKAGLLHLHLGDGARGLSLIRRALEETEIPPRVFHPTHLNRNPRLWQEALALSPRGPYLDLTAFPPTPGEPTAAECIAEYLRAGLDAARLTMSSDGGGCLPTFDHHGVLQSMDVGDSSGLLEHVRGARDLGVDFDKALATVTSNVASLFRLKDRGHLAVGARADLAVLDPATLRVDGVMAGGRWLKRP